MSEQEIEAIDAENAEVDAEEVDAQEAATDTDETEDDSTFDAEKAREKIRKINSEARKLRERTKAAEEKAKGSEEKDSRLTALEAENLRLRVGVKHGLPEALIKRLSGTTEEEILKDAEELMELFGSKKPPTNRPKESLRGGTDPTESADELGDLDKFAEKMFRN